MSQILLDGELYLLDRTIGCGYTAEVIKAVGNKHQLCLKVIHPSFYQSSLGKLLIDNQINILKELDHPNVLKFHHTFQLEGKLALVTQYCPQGTLYDYAKNNKMTQSQIMSIMLDIVEGCAYMHNKSIIHRDLKLENIFMRGKRCKIADLGFATHASDNKLLSINVGSPVYMPLQTFLQKKYSIQSDIFAIGVMWFQLLTGKTPFEGSSEQQLQQNMKKKEMRKCELKCSCKVKETLLKCFSNEPNQRPSLQQIKNIILQQIDTKNKSFREVFHIPSTKSKPKAAQKQNSNLNRSMRATSDVKKKAQGKKILQTRGINITEKGLDSNLINLQKKSISQKTQNTQGSSDIVKLLLKLEEVNMSFLPFSTNLRYFLFLKKYQQILGKNQSQILDKDLSHHNDEFISSLRKSQTQLQLCRCSDTFLRRLIRLTSTYREYSTTTKQLQQLWDHMQTVIAH